jgi:hypothetical protein
MAGAVIGLLLFASARHWFEPQELHPVKSGE